MATLSPPRLTQPPRPLHPLHAILLAFPLPLFLGALLSDAAYRASFHVQWHNFASWLIAGGLAQCRIGSKHLALQIKAIEEGLLQR